MFGEQITNFLSILLSFLIIISIVRGQTKTATNAPVASTAPSRKPTASAGKTPFPTTLSNTSLTQTTTPPKRTTAKASLLPTTLFVKTTRPTTSLAATTPLKTTARPSTAQPTTVTPKIPNTSYHPSTKTPPLTFPSTTPASHATEAQTNSTTTTLSPTIQQTTPPPLTTTPTTKPTTTQPPTSSGTTTLPTTSTPHPLTSKAATEGTPSPTSNVSTAVAIENCTLPKLSIPRGCRHEISADAKGCPVFKTICSDCKDPNESREFGCEKRCKCEGSESAADGKDQCEIVCAITFPDGAKPCTCKTGFVRNGTKCVVEAQCPAAKCDEKPNDCAQPCKEKCTPTGNCTYDKQWLPCGTECPLTCANRLKPPSCPKNCVAGCFCKGSFLDPDGMCIAPNECPEIERCPRLEERKPCSPLLCTCEDISNKRKCREFCVEVSPGTPIPCQCLEGYIRKTLNGPCVPIESCHM